MKLRKHVLLLAVFLSLVICSAAMAETEGESGGETDGKPGDKTVAHVIFIFAEGLSDQRIKSAYTPNLNGLAAGGLKAAAVGVLPSNQAVLRASLLTGASPEIHGFDENNRQIRTVLFPETVSRYGRSSVYICPEASVFRELFTGKSGVKIHSAGSDGNKEVITRAINVFQKEKPYFMGLELPGIAADPEIRDASKKTALMVNDFDEQLGRLLIKLRSMGVIERSLIVFAGDYRETGPTENNLPTEGLTVPLIITGPGLRAGVELPPVKITDVVPTVALLTGIQASPESDGNVLWNAIAPEGSFSEQNLLLKRIRDLSEENLEITGTIYRLAEEKSLVKTEKEKITREKARIQETIAARDREIKSLKWRNRLLKLVEGATVLVMGAGYVAEYFYLRKRFLMF